MNTLSCVLILICCSAMVRIKKKPTDKIYITKLIRIQIFAERPDWYPKDIPAIEIKCREENSIKTDIMAKVWSNQIEDTPKLRKLMLCLARKKNIFNSEMGFKADRFQIILKDRKQMDCKLEFMEECVNGAKDIKPDDVMILNIMKCFVPGMEENCKKIE